MATSAVSYNIENISKFAGSQREQIFQLDPNGDSKITVDEYLQCTSIPSHMRASTLVRAISSYSRNLEDHENTEALETSKKEITPFLNEIASINRDEAAGIKISTEENPPKQNFHGGKKSTRRSKEDN